MPKYYTVYKITNTINNKFYIGKHQTDDLDDGYMGSGKLIRAAVNKYGIDNFTKEILFIFDNENEMNAKEKELVEPCGLNEQSYNLNVGGYGGWNYINKHVVTGDKRSEISKRGGKASYQKQINGEMTEQQRYWFHTKEGMKAAAKKASAALKEKYPPGTWTFTGKKHTDEFKRFIGSITSAHQQGSGNSQYGTCWITNGTENKKIRKEDINHWLSLGYYKGRVNGNVKISNTTK